MVRIVASPLHLTLAAAAMIVWFIRHLFYFRSLFDAKADAHEVALGCAIGMLLGLLPKGNLVAVSLTLVMLALRMHLGAAMISMLAFSVAGFCLDPLSHAIGLLLLTNRFLEPLWIRCYQLPLAPWTSLNNTVVSGSLVLGLLGSGPTYWASKRGVRWLQERRQARHRQRAFEKMSSDDSQRPAVTESAERQESRTGTRSIRGNRVSADARVTPNNSCARRAEFTE